MEKENQNKESRMLKNYLIIVVALMFVVVGIVLRALQVSIVERDKWRELGEKQKAVKVKVYPNRGNIYSCDGKLMATSVPRYYLYMDFKADGLSKDTLNKYIDSMALALSKKFKNRSAASYKQHILKGYNRQSRNYPLYENKVSYLDLKEVQTFPFFNKGRNRSGLYYKEMVQRQKPYGTLASRTIGDIYGELEEDGTSKGKNGIEMAYDSLLQGQHGYATRIKLGVGWARVIEQEPVDGVDIRTTIDLKLQDIVEKALMDKLSEVDADYGTVVLMEVKTGEVKAISNMGRVREGVYAESMNHAIADEVEPGSTFKVASMMVALEDGVVSPQDSVDTGSGIFMYKGAKMTDHNWNKGGYHMLTAEEAIWNSSNIGTAKIILRAYENDPERFVQKIQDLGFAQPMDLGLPGAGKPKIRRPSENPHWSKLSLPWMSFGYETQVPPIYMLSFFNAIANDGCMVKPFFVKDIQKNGRIIKAFDTETIKNSICSDKTLKQIRSMLEGVVENGTGKAAKSELIRIAGKTGTAQISQGALGYKAGGKSHQVTFAGYFPAENPKYSFIITMRRPRKAYPSAGGICGPIAKNIAEKVFGSNIKLKPSDLEPDTVWAPQPQIKTGYYSKLEYALDKLNVRCNDDDVETNWVDVDMPEDKAILTDLNISDELVPKVTGMGATDAVYALESIGLRVSISGRGKVVSQSIPAGRKFSKGQSISLTLK
ncbi:MAG: penicillin-binding protein [Tannerellaceae bacterium]